MGIIFGIYNVDSSEVKSEYSSNMIEKLSKYPLDKLDSWQNKQIYFGCGVQYDTPESLLEELPKYYKELGLTVTADAIIDNREELFKAFKISEDLWSKTTDSKLIALAYEKWQEDSPKHLIGDFSFAIWDEKRQQLFCARDHVGKRTLYYYSYNNIFAFSTTISPLFAVSNKVLNERWLTDFLALNGVLHVVESRETPYENIFQLPPAHTITVNIKGIVKKHYWKPLENIKQLKLKTDEEYDRAFRKVFFEAVNCRLRSSGGIAVMLSGGLDSSAVACTAAKKLAKKGEKLKAFSSIPINEYKNKLPKYFLPDESEYIKTNSDLYSNILINYCRSEDKNSYIGIEEFVNMLEQPYKIFQNLFWYNNFAKKAAQEGCSILLNGQSGNSTISYGEFTVHAKTLFKKGRIIALSKEINSFSKKIKIPRRKIARVILKVIAPYSIRKIISNNITNRNYDKFSPVMVNAELLKKWRVKQRFYSEGYNEPLEKYYDLYENHKYIVDDLAFTHISTIETKVSLENKIAIRDPSRDKRMIEFCLSLPSDQFVRNGNERLIIRRALKGIIPDKIRLNVQKRGTQSADWVQRLKPYWKDIKNELESIINSHDLIKKYIDLGKVKKELEKIGDKLGDENEESLRRLFIVLVFNRFLKCSERG